MGEEWGVVKQYILAHDLGTSGNKATLFALDGKLIASYTATYKTNYFNGNWAEQNAEDYWQAVCESTKMLLRQTKIAAASIAVVSFSGQMQGCICVDQQGTPLRNAIIWADQRASEQSKQLEQKLSQQQFYEIVGHRNSPAYGIQKLMWIRDHERVVYEQTYKVLNAKDFIVFKLTNNFYTDYSDANGMGCFNIHNLSWSEEILQAAKISIDKLPECKPSTFVAGHVTEQASRFTGLPVGIPVVIGGGDGVTASIGAGSVEPGKTYCCLGTSAWISTASETPFIDEEMRIFTWVHAIPGLYAPAGTMQSAGGAINWMRHTLTNDTDWQFINREIKASPAGANNVLFLPYLIGERAPRWDTQAKGAFFGLTSETTKGDMYRSIIEGISHNLTLILDILKQYQDVEEMLLIGGGARNELWQEILANMFQTNIHIPHILEEACSMGAAVIGGVGVGLFEDFRVIDHFLTIKDTKLPNHNTYDMYTHHKQRFDLLYKALKPLTNEKVHSKGVI